MDKAKLVNWINKLIREDNIHAFYISGRWIRLRAEALKRDNKECQQCKARGKARRAKTVHHIKHVKEHPSLALSMDNLMSLCNECHNEVHPEKLEKYRAKNIKEQLNEEKW